MSTVKVGYYFNEDCSLFLSKFKDKGSLQFDAFAAVWQEMKFSFVLTQWKYLGEMQEIVEEYLKVCKRIWLKSETVEERVCGLYLLRAIYLKQPAARYMKISLSHDDWQCLKHFLYLIKDFQQNETRYVLQELFELNAFVFSVPDCTLAEGKEDVGLLESLGTQFTKVQTQYREMFSALEQENKEYNEQRRACLRVYPELSSFSNAETDSLVGQLMERLTVFEDEVSKVGDDFNEANVTVIEDVERRTSMKRKRISYRVKAVGDCCETEESSESGDDSNILDMPQLHSEDSDEGVEDEETCDVPIARRVDKGDVHMSDFELSSVSSEDDEGSSKCTAATGSSKDGPATAVGPKPGAASKPTPQPPAARRGRRFGRRSAR
ncbi:uncharacterized protein LOC126108557 [Schistocerca cancellata]|uniref:uncharacterized protein LOC126108557 n=1 Tax=Schistocerca cancellata TaxID=274614 RepID=UPI002118428B|nr:uncharacterized protein LOC126108557 [Schistocerca cancellata]